MKRFLVSVTGSLLAFTAGLVTASSWTAKPGGLVGEPMVVFKSCPPSPAQPPPPAPVQSFTVTPPHEFEFGQKGLKLVPEQVQLKSESLRYKVDVSYPQIVGSDDLQIQKVNLHLKNAATKLYHWTTSAGASLPDKLGIYSTVNFTYQTSLATDALLSVSFIGFSYGPNGADQTQQSFSVNYDLTSGKLLKLTDVFKRDSDYLRFISRYCLDALSSKHTASLLKGGLAPLPVNFDNWHITTKGIIFEFAPCEVRNCSEGEEIVEIPFGDLQAILNPGIPGRFKITQP